MKHTRSVATTLLLYMIGVAYTGMIVSMLLTNDPRWMEWHLSRLGEGGHLSSYIFNASAMIVGVLLVLFGKYAARELSIYHPDTKQRQFVAILGAMGACLFGVALFPFDQFHVVHNIFGYGFFLSAGILMMALSSIVPTISSRTYQLGLAAAAITTTLMVLHHLVHFTPLLVVELVGQLFLFAWLMAIAFEADGRAVSTKPLRQLGRTKL